MAYGLGVTYNIARQAPTLRDFQSYVATYPKTVAPVAPAPTPRPTISVPRTTTTTTTTTATNPKTTTATVTPPKTFTPKPPLSVSSVATTQPMASDGTPLTVGGGDIEIGDVFSPSKSPLLLIAAGIAALMLLENRKKGRR